MRPFLDVPVYRLCEDEYNRQLKEFIERGLAPLREQLGEQVAKHGYMIDHMHQHLFKVYGGCWRFNEVVGYIRLHFLGSQVRGEYFTVNRKRIVRTRHKRFEYVSHKLAPEIEIEMPVTDQTVGAAVSKYLQACQRELPRRYIDIDTFTVLAPHIRWYALWATENPFGRKRTRSSRPARTWPRRPRRRANPP